MCCTDVVNNQICLIQEEEDVKCDQKVEELNEVIHYQQSIIENMTHKITELEIIKRQLSQERQEYEELLQQNRFNLKKIRVNISSLLQSPPLATF